MSDQPMKRMRHFLTGEWIEVPYLTPQESRISIEPPGGAPRRKGNIWRRGLESYSMGVHPHQAKRFTAEAKKAGIHGVEYSTTTGKMISTDRVSRAAEATRRGFHDADGGCVEQKYGALLGL